MGHDVVRHHALMPGVSKTAQAVGAARCLEDSLHVPMMTILSCIRKTLTRPVKRAARSERALSMAPGFVTQPFKDGRFRILIVSRANRKKSQS
jgi:hypothetical protein